MSDKKSTRKPLWLLFLDRTNTSTGLMAEAILRAKGGERYMAASAGLAPEAKPLEACMNILRQNNISTDKLVPKNFSEFQSAEQAMKIELVICLGADMAQEPLNMIGRPARVNWDVDDPEAATAPDQIEWRAKKAFATLNARIDEMLKQDLPSAHGELEMELQRIGRIA